MKRQFILVITPSPENCVTTFRTKVAVTVVLTLSVIEQLAGVLEHPVAFPVPLVQLTKVEPLLPVPSRINMAPFGYCPAQVLKCAPPSVLHMTVPIPFPACKIDSATDVGAPGNMAVTAVSASTVNTHNAVPEHPPPLQPVKPVPLAVNVTTIFVGKTKEQIPTPALQLIPSGVDVTVPPLVIMFSIFNEV
jgi:hypothetical protein